MRIRRTITRNPLFWAFIIPMLMMTIYWFGVRHVYPFGNGSLLTVDMGQQYVDFYAYFRETILGHPGQLFYGWNKALGGDMYGVWAYYLLSPFNFITLLFPKSILDLAITIMTLAKYGTAGLTMAYFLKQHHIKGALLPAYGTMYALSGWMVANQLNLMWLDGVIILPLVAAGIDQLFRRKPRQYLIWLAVALITNYYIAYMICLFAICYFLFALARERPIKQQLLRVIGRFTCGSLLAGGTAAAVIIPTFYQLTRSKGTYTVTDVHFKMEYNPLQFLSKLFSGAFNFDQMPSGLPNVFIGALAIMGVIVYLLATTIDWRERLAALGVGALLVFSMMFEPLDLLWHGMQFPVWYPYRFSFVFCFFMIYLAALGINAIPHGIGLVRMLLLTGMTLMVTGYVWLNLDSFSFLTKSSVTLSAIYALLAIMILSAHDASRRLSQFIILGFAIIDMGTSAVLAFNQVSYVTHSDYHTYTETLRRGVDAIQKRDAGNYRIAKTVMRTKNDAMQIGYMGEDQFNSMFEPDVPRFYSAIGQPEGDGFVTYANGTLLTDAFLDTKYWLSQRHVSRKVLGNTLLPALSTRPDLNEYEHIAKTKLLNVSRNQNALGIGFAASPNMLKTKLNALMPLTNQEYILAGLTGNNYTAMYSSLSLGKPQLQNIRPLKQFGAVYYSPRDTAKDAVVTYRYKAATSDPVYLTVGSDFTDHAANITLNGKTIAITDSFRSDIVLNVTPEKVNQWQTLRFRFKKKISFDDVALYQLDKSLLTADLTTLRQNTMTDVKRGSNSLRGNVTTTISRSSIFLSVPNDPGWHVKVDGKTVQPHTVFGLLMGIKTKAGRHQLRMYYLPPFLGVGAMVSLLSLLLAWIYLRRKPKHTH